MKTTFDEVGYYADLDADSGGFIDENECETGVTNYILIMTISCMSYHEWDETGDDLLEEQECLIG